LIQTTHSKPTPKLAWTDKNLTPEFKQSPRNNIADTSNLQNYLPLKNSIVLKESLKDYQKTSNGSLMCYFNLENKLGDQNTRQKTLSTDDNFAPERNHQSHFDHSYLYAKSNLRNNYCSKRSLSTSRISTNNNSAKFDEFELFYKKRLEMETIL